MKLPALLAFLLFPIALFQITTGARAPQIANDVTVRQTRRREGSTRRGNRCEGLNSQRPHLASISNVAWRRFERAVVALKANGVYDRYVDIHRANVRVAHGGTIKNLLFSSSCKDTNY